MTNRDDPRLWARIAAEYNPPPETPRDEMWDRIAARIAEGDESGGEAHVVDLSEARERRGADGTHATGPRRWAGWAVAAAALLVLGVGIGRMTAPERPLASEPEATTPRAGSSGLGLAAREHLGRTESLLTMVRADARDGRVDSEVAAWAEDLLAQTRLLLDRPDGVEPELRDLLLDLELVLVQVVGIAETGADDDRARTEVELTLRSLDEGEVLPRIQATLPQTMSGA